VYRAQRSASTVDGRRSTVDEARIGGDCVAATKTGAISAGFRRESLFTSFFRPPMLANLSARVFVLRARGEASSSSGAFAIQPHTFSGDGFYARCD
jgi:hypothetical protein